MMISVRRGRFALLFALAAASVGLPTHLAQADDRPPRPPLETLTDNGGAQAGRTAEADGENKQAGEAASGTTKAKRRDPLELELLPLRGTYADHPQPLGFDPASLLVGAASGQKSFYRLCDYLDRLADKNESGAWVVLDLSAGSLSLNLAQTDEFVRRFQDVAKNKRTVAWLENASGSHLAIAAQCDKVIMADFGSLDLSSVAMESLFFKDAMDLLGVQASVVRAGDFKGAVEPFLNPRMSDHLREHNLRMLTTLNDARVRQIAEGRGLAPEAVRSLQATRFLTPRDALEAGLVDRLAPYGSMKQTIAAMTKQDDVEWNSPKKKPKKKMSFFELMSQLMSGPQSNSSDASETSIAVLHLNGPIVDGRKKSGGSLVSGPAVKAIQSLIDDKNVKAVVVRINSPGGSATASEAIRQQLLKLKEAKPTIVSMGEIAASGGYWISCIDVPVYAERGTITGSIGVFSLKISAGALLRRVGVHVESITLDDSAAAFSVARPFSDAERKAFQSHVDMVYERFLKLVSKSREMKIDAVKPLAGGRVWSGTQAKSLGLVDELGGVDACIARLARETKLDDYEVIHRPVVNDALNILSLLGEEGPEEIHGLVPASTLKLLQRRGFTLQPTLMLLEAATRHRQGGPQLWLLHPAEVRLR